MAIPRKIQQEKPHPAQLLLPAQRVELILPGQKQPKVLVPEVDMMTVTPSPNGEWLALRCGLPSSQERMQARMEERLLLVNRKGEVIEVGMGK